MVDNWREHAACRGENPELFFPIGTSGPALQQIEQAKAICGRCPVVAQCLAAALDHGEDAGIWGGLTAEERRVVRQARARRLARLAAVRSRLDGATDELTDAAGITELRAGSRSAESRRGRSRRTGPTPPPRREPSTPTERRA